VVGHGAHGHRARRGARRRVGARASRVSDGREDGGDAGRFYRDVARAGYRSAYLRSLASSVASGELDLEALAADRELPDDEVETRLLALPGVGPYAAAHVMMLIGRYSRLVLDSWTRPTYARLNGRKAKDTTIERRFRPYGRTPVSRFWLYLTRDWVSDDT
jgi:3-methyladenine DNA glycosylase/8-oxoguanine DNA glycosylase